MAQVQPPRHTRDSGWISGLSPKGGHKERGYGLFDALHPPTMKSIKDARVEPSCDLHARPHVAVSVRPPGDRCAAATSPACPAPVTSPPAVMSVFRSSPSHSFPLFVCKQELLPSVSSPREFPRFWKKSLHLTAPRGIWLALTPPLGQGHRGAFPGAPF